MVARSLNPSMSKVARRRRGAGGSGLRAVRMMSVPLARASRAVSSPMPELPPIPPRRRCSRWQFRPGLLRFYGGGVPIGPVRVALAMSGTTFALRRLDRPPGGTLGRPLGRRGSAGPITDVRSADTGVEQSWDDSGRPPTSQDPRPPPKLLGRRSECEALDRLLADARAGRSRVTVLRGEAGVGKSALLGYLSERVTGWHVARAAGVESEMELAYAGLHQLCAPMLGNLGRLPLRSATRSRRCSAAAQAPCRTGSW